LKQRQEVETESRGRGQNISSRYKEKHPYPVGVDDTGQSTVGSGIETVDIGVDYVNAK